MKRSLHAFRSSLITAWLFVFLCVPILAKAAEYKPMISVGVSSFEQLMKVSGKFAELAETQDAFAMVQMMFGQMPGFDNTKPIGLVFLSDGENCAPLLFLPVKNLDEFKNAVPGISYFLELAEKTDDGKFSVEMFGGSFLIEQKSGWLIAYPEENADIVPADPAKLLKGLNEKYLLSFAWDLENTPKELVGSYLGMIEPMFEMMDDPARLESFHRSAEQLETLLDEGKSMLFGIAVAPSDGAITIDTVLEVKPETDAAKTLQQQKNAKIHFNGFFQPAAALAFVSAQEVPESQKEALLSMFNAYADGFAEQLEYSDLGEKEMQLATEIADLAKEIAIATVEKGKMDCAGSFTETGTLLFASSVSKGMLIGDALKKLVDHAGEEDTEFVQKNVKLNYGSFEGYQLSRISLPLNEIPDLELPENWKNKSFQLYVGIKDDAVCAACGSDEKAEETLKKAITDSKSEKPLPKLLAVGSPAKIAKAIRALGVVELHNVAEDVVAALEKSAPDAKITLENEIQNYTQKMKLAVPGSVVASFIDLAKLAKELRDGGYSDDDEEEEVEEEDSEATE